MRDFVGKSWTKAYNSVIILLQPPMCWGYRLEPLHLALCVSYILVFGAYMFIIVKYWWINFITIESIFTNWQLITVLFWQCLWCKLHTVLSNSSQSPSSAQILIQSLRYVAILGDFFAWLSLVNQKVCDVAFHFYRACSLLFLTTTKISIVFQCSWTWTFSHIV